MRTSRASFFSRSSTCRSISSTGTRIDTRRSSAPNDSTFAAIQPLPRLTRLPRLLRREGLEPSCLEASAPKAGASTNTATFAAVQRPEKRDKNNVLYPRVSVGHYENFPVASLLLPAALREPVGAIYRFARGADDIADEGDDAPEMRLEKLRNYRMQLEPPSELASLIRRHDLPVGLFEDLLDAFAQDVTKKRYANFPELLEYCRRSANPVGRLLLHLFRRTTDSDLACSDAICSALQLIDFWQDVEIDYAKGRIYLPQDEMARHDVTEQDRKSTRLNSSH